MIGQGEQSRLSGWTNMALRLSLYPVLREVEMVRGFRVGLGIRGRGQTMVRLTL